MTCDLIREPLCERAFMNIITMLIDFNFGGQIHCVTFAFWAPLAYHRELDEKLIDERRRNNLNRVVGSNSIS